MDEKKTMPGASTEFTKKEIKALIVPLILEQLLALLVGLADTVMVAGVGNTAVSAVSLVDSFFALIMLLFSAMAAGGGVVVGQYIGQGDKSRTRTAAAQLLLVLFGGSILITAVLELFYGQILGLFFGKTEQDIMINCITYYRIVMLSVPFLALYNGAAALYRIRGDSKTPMKTSVLMNLLNVIGNAVCINLLKMGVAGAALPSVLSRVAAMVILRYGTLTDDMKLTELSLYRPVKRIMKNIFSIGIPNAVESGMFQFGKLLLMSLISTLPTASITANAIGNTIGTLRLFVGIGTNLGLTSLVSRCVGAKDYKQARKITFRLIRFVYIAQGAVCIVLILAMPLINRLYGVSGEAAHLSTQINLVHSVSSMILWPFCFMLNTAMTAAGDSRYVMIGSSISMWIGRVLFSYVLIMGFGFGVLSVWIAWEVDWCLRLFFFIPRWRSGVWETKAIKD
ncbi:MAG: MATE family efflux transporter [Clostridia bacterium]|nr:MATE family efflux transporter [Clostridia bacterium]